MKNIYLNITNKQARKLPNEIQKKCIRLTDGSWDIFVENIPEELRLNLEKSNFETQNTKSVIFRDSSQEVAGVSSDRIPQHLSRFFTQGFWC